MNARLTLAIGGAALAPGAQVSPLSCIQAPHESSVSSFNAFQVSKLHKPAHLCHPSITLSLLNLPFFILFIYLFYLFVVVVVVVVVAPCGILDPSSPTRNRTHIRCIGSVES